MLHLVFTKLIYYNKRHSIIQSNQNPLSLQSIVCIIYYKILDWINLKVLFCSRSLEPSHVHMNMNIQYIEALVQKA